MAAFHWELDDDTDREADSSRAWNRARQIAADCPSPDWPELPPGVPPELAPAIRRALNEVYFYGLLFCIARMHLVANSDGVDVYVPPLHGVDGFEPSRRHFSFETLLPFIYRGVPPDEARAMAHRLRGLAKICDDQAGLGET